MSDKVENNQENIKQKGKSPTFNTFSAPHPLTESEFERIVILRYIESLSGEELKNIFDKKPTKEDLLEMLKTPHNVPKKLISGAEKNMMDTFKVMQNAALEGNAEVAWTISESYACFSPEDLKYIAVKEGNTSNLRPYIQARFSQNQAMSLTLDFVETVENANQIAGSANVVSMKNAEKIYNKLRNYERNLDAEQKSAIYFLSSEIYRRAQIVPGIYHEPKPCAKEILCLRMVLENTSEASLVDCCLDRMSKDSLILKDNNKRLITAYKRVLEAQKLMYPEDNYRINSQIAKLYQQQVQQMCSSFSGISLEDSSVLRWAEYYYCQAYKKASNATQKHEALNKIAGIQAALGLSQKSKQTTLKALNLLSAPERFEKMLDMVSNEEGRIAILKIKNTIQKIKKSKMPLGIKNLLGQKAIIITKLKTKDEKVISSVEKMVSNINQTPNNKVVRNVSTHE